jgi:hypothetical protein
MTRRLTDSETRPLMLKAGLLPLVPYPGNNKPWKCRCLSCDEEVFPHYGSVRSGQGGCVHCGKRASGATQRLSEYETVQRMNERNLEPLEPYTGKDARWKSRCLICDSIVFPTLGNVSQGHGCAVCASKERGLKLMLDPVEASKEMKNAGATPVVDYPGYNSRWRCICISCGSNCYPRLADIRRGQGPCGVCRYTKSAASLRKPEGEAVQRFIDAGLEPLEPYRGHFKPWKSRCMSCKKIVWPALGNVITGASLGCRYCAGQAVDGVDAEKVMKEGGLTPLVPYVNSQTLWKCRCDSCQRIVTPTYNGIQQGRGGCRHCADFGFDYNGPAILYLITHPEFDAIKVGIAGAETNRLRLHERNGWGQELTWSFKVGEMAKRVESEVLAWWRNDLRIPKAVNKEQMPQRGETETASLSKITVEETAAFVDDLLLEESYGWCQ